MNIPIDIWILCIILPILTGIVVSILIYSSYQKELDRYRQDRIDTSDLQKKKRIKILMFMFTTFVPSIYGIVIIYLLNSFEGDLLDYQKVAVSLLGIVVGIPLMVSMITQGSIIKRFMGDYIKEKELDLEEIRKRSKTGRTRPEPVPFSRYLLIAMVPQTVAIYGLVIGIMMLSFGSIAGGSSDADDNSTMIDDSDDRTYAIDEENIDQVRIASWVFAVLSLFTISVAILPFLVKGSMMDDRIFKKRILLSIAGTIPAMVGLAIWITAMSISF